MQHLIKQSKQIAEELNRGMRYVVAKPRTGKTRPVIEFLKGRKEILVLTKKAAIGGWHSELEAMGVTKSDSIIADSAEPKSIAEINREGYNIRGVKKGKDSIESGIALMKQYPIFVVGSSPNLKKELVKSNPSST